MLARATAVLTVIAAGALAGEAAARPPLAGTTVGVEWEVLDQWAIGVKDKDLDKDKKVLKSLHPSKKLLCTRRDRNLRAPGFTGDFPIFAITYDLQSTVDPTLYTLELVSGPIVTPEGAGRGWIDAGHVAAAFADFYEAVHAETRKPGCGVSVMLDTIDGSAAFEKRQCFVPMSTILANLNLRSQSGGWWEYCDANEKLGDVIGIYAQAPDKPLKLSVQTNVAVDVAAFATPEIVELLGSHAAQRADHAEVLKVLRTLTETDEEVLGFLALHMHTANLWHKLQKVRKQKGGLVPDWAVKALFDLFPKASLKTLYDAMPDKQQSIAKHLTNPAVKDFCYPRFRERDADVCDAIKALDLKLTTVDTLAYNTITDPIAPGRSDDKRALIVVEVREPGSPLNRHFETERVITHDRPTAILRYAGVVGR